MKATISTIKNCRECLLYKNQTPLLDTSENTNVFWVGLSAVKVKDTNTSKPLDANTRTGMLIEQIEEQIGGVSFYRTNLVKCFPESVGKIRYPTQKEMSCCFPNLVSELNNLSPKVVVLLGKQVADYVFKHYGKNSYSLNNCFSYEAYKVDGVSFIPVHHPSYILIYHRRNLNKYVDEISNIINENLNSNYEK